MSELLAIIPVLVLLGIILLLIRARSGVILPTVLTVIVAVLLVFTILIPVIESTDTSEAAYDDYILIDSDTDVSGAFEKVTAGDLTYAHAKNLGLGTVGDTHYVVKKAKLDVYLIMGQSNAAYNYYDLDTATPVANPGRAYYYGTDTQPVTQTVPGDGMYDAVNLDGSAKIGHLEQPFMAKYTELTDHKVYTINTGWNGANIALLTVGGSHYGYEQRTANAGFRAINQSYYDVAMIGYIWLQGEADAGLDTPINDYKSMFLDLFNAIRGDGADKFTTLFTMDCSFIVQTRTNRGENVATALTELASDNQDIFMATEVTLTFTDENGLLRGDNLHYSQAGFNIIGVAVAEYIVSNVVSPNL